MAQLPGNPHRFVPIEIGGKPFNLRYGFNQIALLERELGKPAGSIDFMQLGFSGQRAMLWGALIHDKRQAMSIEEVGELLEPYLKDPKAYGEIMEAVARAYTMAFPDPPKEEEAPKNAPATSGIGG